MHYLDVEALTEISDVVVRGVVVDSRVFVGNHDRITTEWTVRVEETLAGEAHDEVRFRQWAGELDGVVEHVPGDARVRLGEHAVFFLVGDTPDGLFLAALGQSKFAIDVEAVPPLPAQPDLLQLPSLVASGLILEAEPIRRVDDVPGAATAVRDLSNIGLLPREGGDIVFLGPESMALDELVDRVRTAAGGAR